MSARASLIAFAIRRGHGDAEHKAALTVELAQFRTAARVRRYYLRESTNALLVARMARRFGYRGTAAEYLTLAGDLRRYAHQKGGAK